MARPASGSVLPPNGAQRSWAIRFVAYGKRRQLSLGRPEDGWTRQRAEEELENVLADVRTGHLAAVPARARRGPERGPDIPRVRERVAGRSEGEAKDAREPAVAAEQSPAPALRPFATRRHHPRGRRSIRRGEGWGGGDRAEPDPQDPRPPGAHPQAGEALGLHHRDPVADAERPQTNRAEASDDRPRATPHAARVRGATAADSRNARRRRASRWRGVRARLGRRRPPPGRSRSRSPRRTRVYGEWRSRWRSARS